MTKGIVFDLDGTLIDSAPDIHAAAVKMLAGEGLEPLSLATIRSFIGNGIPHLVKLVMEKLAIEFSPSEHDRLTAIFVDFYNAAPADLTTVFPGLIDVLEALKAQGYVMGVCTNKPKAPAVAILEAFDLSQYFDVVFGGDALPQRKPDPAPLIACFDEMGTDQRLYVGDSEVDAETADRAAVPFAIYTEGYRKTPVEELVHTWAFADFSDLPAIIAAAFPTKADA